MKQVSYMSKRIFGFILLFLMAFSLLCLLQPAAEAEGYSVTITAGSNMTKTEGSGAALQTGLSGAMADVVYTADEGYYFPPIYSVDAVSGISVTRDSYTQITVSGTPTADAVITLNDAAAVTEVVYVAYNGKSENDGKSPDTALDFYSCFDQESCLKSDFSGKTLVFCGEFTDLGEDYIYIDQEIDLIGDEAVFKDVTFIISSDNVSLKNFKISEEKADYAIYISYCENVTIEGNTIDMTSLSGYDSYAVYSMDCENLIMLDNEITYVGNIGGEKHINNAVRVKAIQKDGKTTVEGNTFDITIPSLSASYDYYPYATTVYSEGIVFDGCAKLTVSDNEISVKCNAKDEVYDMINGVSIVNYDAEGKEPREMNVTMEGNSIYVSGRSYTYAVNIDAYTFESADCMIHYNLVDNTINASGENVAYCLELQNVVMGEVKNNELYADAKEYNCGIYHYPFMGANEEIAIVDNSITGKGRYSAGMNINTAADISITGNEIQSLGSNALDESGRVVSTGLSEHPARTSPAIILVTRGSANSALISGNEIRAGGAGVILGGRSSTIDVVNNDIVVNDAIYGIEIAEHGEKTNIKENTISVTTLENDKGYGIYSYDSNGVSILNNTMVYTGKSDGLKEHFNNAVYVSGKKGASDIEIAGNTLDINLTTQSVTGQEDGERPLLGGLVFDGCDNLKLLDNTISMKAADGCMSNGDLYGADLILLKAEPRNAIGQAEVKGNSIMTPGVGIHCLVPSEMTDNLVLSGSEYAVDVFAGEKAEDNASIVTGNKLRSAQLWGDASVFASNVDTVRDNKDIHEFIYVADGATIIATCANTEGNCTLDDGTEQHAHTATLTLNAPTLTTYGQTGEGISADATVTDENGIRGDAKILYQKKTGDATYDTATETAPTDAGTYKAGITLGEGEGAATASVEYTIAQAETSITANPTAGEITYGQKLENSTLTDGTASVDGSFAWKDSTVAPAVSDSQTTEYDVVFTPTDANYATAECKVKLTVNKAASAVTTAPTAKTLTYTGEAQELVNAGSAAGGTMQYSLDGVSYSEAIPTGTAAGSYTVYYKVVGDANHSDTEPASVTVKITYTVTFETDGGMPIPKAQQVESGKYATYPNATPVKTGNSFDGWQLNGEPFRFATTPITENITLAAKWKADKYVIIWVDDDGTFLGATTVSYGDMPSFNAPDRKQDAQYTYTFDAWTPALQPATEVAVYKATYTAVSLPAFGEPDFTLPALTRTIGESAFEGLPMTVVEIPDGCETIGKWAFKDCASLKQIRIPASVMSINTTAFDGCANVLVYGTAGSAAQTFCDNHANFTFCAE